MADAAALHPLGTMSPGLTDPSSLDLGGEPTFDGDPDDSSGLMLGGFFLLT